MNSRSRQVNGISVLSLIGGICVATAAFLPACGSSDSGDSTDQSSKTGQELFASQCSACHGTQGEGSIGPNITGSTSAGIGSWTAAQFATAVRTGVDDEGEELCTQMTRFSAAALSDDQVTKIHDYLMMQMNDTELEGSGCP